MGLTTGYDSRKEDGTPDLPLNLGGEMITYYLADLEAEITLRSSGTEPKIKFYSEMRVADTQGDDESGRRRIAKLVRAVVLQLLNPDRNRLQKRPTDVDFYAGGVL